MRLLVLVLASLSSLSSLSSCRRTANDNERRATTAHMQTAVLSSSWLRRCLRMADRKFCASLKPPSTTVPATPTQKPTANGVAARPKLQVCVRNLIRTRSLSSVHARSCMRAFVRASSYMHPRSHTPVNDGREDARVRAHTRTHMHARMCMHARRVRRHQRGAQCWT